jgi:hemin uptake protein HemP
MTMSESKDLVEQKTSPPSENPPPRVWRAEELFAGDQEIWIEHSGVRYRLRITKRNRLLLQK